jgi:hypothetical protein
MVRPRKRWKDIIKLDLREMDLISSGSSNSLWLQVLLKDS